MSKKVHDADLCDRIRGLEDEVRELRKEVEVAQHHHCYHYYPYWNTSPWHYPTVTWTNGTSTTTTNPGSWITSTSS